MRARLVASSLLAAVISCREQGAVGMFEAKGP